MGARSGKPVRHADDNDLLQPNVRLAAWPRKGRGEFVLPSISTRCQTGVLLLETMRKKSKPRLYGELRKELSDAIRIQQKAMADFQPGEESTLRYELPKVAIADCLLRLLGLETQPPKKARRA